MLTSGTYWLLANWPQGMGMDKKERDISFGPDRIKMPVKSAPVADWLTWCMWNHQDVDCPSIYILHEGPLVCSTVEAWRLSRDLTPAQVADGPPGSVCSEFMDLPIHHPISSK